ncbi:uroporphyrinogen-III C-methyltransferase [Rheinheimera texasensis]|uniref:uroporphyrinogen-III C-methyltransferase n=1 Tax=Rheinheimera texasensis TaxID=306205 RepID=UPI0032B1DDF2
MSEQSPVLATDSTPAATKPVAAGGGKLALTLGSLALLIALGAAAAAGWAIYSLQPQLNSMSEQQQSLTNQQQSQISFFQSKLDEMQQNMQQQLTVVSADVNGKVEQQALAAQTELQKLQQQLDRQSGNIKGWQLLEIDYFLRLAEQKLFLEQNISGVQQVLELAEQRLKQANDPSLTPVREAIDQDKRMLGELNAPDLNQLHLTLSSLRQQSLVLPLRQSERPMDNGTEEEITEDSADWQANLALYWRNFWRGLVQVRASLPEDGVSLTAEQQISVRNTLTQQLLLAELAAMQHNQAVYAAAIQQSADSLQRYFAATEPAVQQMADELVVLSALQVSLPLLAPLKSPAVFDAYRQGTLEAESAL